MIWSRRVRFSPICSKLLDVVPPLERIDRSFASPRLNVSASTAERSVLAATDSLRAASACRLASVTSCSLTRIETTRDAYPWLRSRLTAVRPVSAFAETVLPVRSFCHELMNAVFPTVDAEVAPDSMACRPDSPPTSAVPKFSMRLSAAQAMNGMLMAR